jgi:hypothetical protein
MKIPDLSLALRNSAAMAGWFREGDILHHAGFNLMNASRRGRTIVKKCFSQIERAPVNLSAGSFAASDQAEHRQRAAECRNARFNLHLTH